MSLEQTKSNLQKHALAVKALASPDAPLGIGLWLSASAARQVKEEGPEAFADWLGERGLEVFTINGFPYGDFHRDVVKHDVYRPDWRQAERLEYTLDLAQVLAVIVPEGGQGSISTLPLGWGGEIAGDAAVSAAAANLRAAAEALRQLEQRTGRLIHLDIEPEPGCRLQTSCDVVGFFERHLPEPGLRRYLRVCHDICHAAVMFEAQDDVVDRYDAAGIDIGKVQVSSAVRAELDGVAEELLGPIRDALRERFDEPRYLHQTVVRTPEGGQRFYEDLPRALEHASRGEWRVHFHVPIFLPGIDSFGTTRGEIDACLDRLAPREAVRHWEVETYAWDVLPESTRGTLAEDIAHELVWFESRLAERAP